MGRLDDLPEPYKSLVFDIRRTHPDYAEHHGARAELEARPALANLALARRLVWATWALFAATIGVVFATVGLIIVALND